MNIKELFLNLTKKKSASIAKERLQIVVSHERTKLNSKDILPKLRQEILTVINKYYNINPDDIAVELQKNGNCSILELNVTLSEKKKDNFKKQELAQCD